MCSSFVSLYVSLPSSTSPFFLHPRFSNGRTDEIFLFPTPPTPSLSFSTASSIPPPILNPSMVEQNKSLQSGAAISMGKMVNSATGPPVVAFQKLCPRICKLLNSPNYITKASLLPVVGSLSQNKLQNLAGQRSDVLENLSPIVRARVDALKDIQMRGTICPTQNWDVISWSIWDHGQQAQCTRGLINDS
uniref:TORTIFOLIA1/SINE1-2 N-terminal domain-containing protein n=1 Tax=Brassica oleracea var. oleracea TaxID=109376 RepID=A0A0D3ALK8_BRAOL